MNLKKKLKKFFAQNRSNDGGFTLVELIVVIAILGILAGVGTVGYSGYIKKANMAADQQLFSDIETAIHLAYYGDRDNFDFGYVALSPNSDAVASTADLQAAMATMFGEDWAATLRVKSSEWESASYAGSSFHGSETALLTTVEGLTETLEQLISTNNSLVGANFTNFMNGISVDTSDNGAIADAAVLYVAKDSAQMSAEQRQQAINAMAGMMVSGFPTADNFNGSVVAASAAYYAMVEGYCRYAAEKGNSAPLDALNASGFGTNPTDAQTAVNTKVEAVMAVIRDGDGFKDGTYAEEYFAPGGRAAQDAAAYLDVMSTVDSARDEILKTGTLGADNFYNSTTLNGLFGMVADGGAIITCTESGGVPVVRVPGKN